MGFIVLIAAAACLSGLGFGVNWIYQQHERITTYQPVSVEVENSWVRRSGSRKYRSYEPVIEYKFEKDGTWYRATGLYPAYSKGRQSWAKEMVTKFPPGKVIEAYIDPANPKEAFLIRHYSSVPYSVFLIAGLVTVVVIGIGFEISTNHKKYQTEGEVLPLRSRGQSSGGSSGVEQWVVLTPRKKLSSRASMWGWLTFFSFMFLLTYSHYLWFADRPYELFGYIFSGISLSTSICLAIAWIIVRRAAGAYSDAMLAIERTEIAQGELLSATMAITPATYIPSGTLSCRIICIETQTKKVNRKQETSDVKVVDQSLYEEKLEDAQPQTPIVRDFTIVIPTYSPLQDHQYEENPGVTNISPKYDNDVFAWSLLLNLKVKGKPDYTGEFPLKIERPFSVSANDAQG